MDLDDSPKTDDLPLRPMDMPRASIGLRHLMAIAIVTPVLMAAGVFWLHHLPIGTAPQTSDAIIEVHLTPQDPVEHIQETVSPPKSQSPTTQPDPIIENSVRSIPQDEPVAKPSETKAIEPVDPAQKPEPSRPETRSQAEADQTALTFQRTLLSHIARYRQYPEDVLREGIHGTVTVLFAMRRDGTVADVWVRTTSGNRRLDAAAIDTIRRAVPLPHIPSELPDRLNVLIPVAFNLP